MTLITVFSIVELEEVAEGVREHLDHPEGRWEHLKSICF